MGYFEANPTFLEPEGDLVFGLYDIDMEAAAPYLEASMRVFPALARVVIKSCGEWDCDHPVVTFYCAPESDFKTCTVNANLPPLPPVSVLQHYSEFCYQVKIVTTG